MRLSDINELQAIRFLSKCAYEEKLGIYESLQNNQDKVFEDIDNLTDFLKKLFERRATNWTHNDYIDENGELHRGSGICFNNTEGLNLLSNGRGNSIISSGQELMDFVYRGQTQCFGSCKPTIFRGDPKTGDIDFCQKTIDITRTIIFKEFLKYHPFIQMIKDPNIIEEYAKYPNKHFKDVAHFLTNEPFYIDEEGLAQHYGFSTSLLDTTTNIDVAAFFATCKYKGGNDIQFIENGKGVFYVITWFHPIIFKKLGIIGWQPLPRPQQQCAFAMAMTEKDDLDKMTMPMPVQPVYRFYFRQFRTNSQRAFRKVKKKNLFIPSEIDLVVKQIMKENKFGEFYIDKAYNKLKTYFPNHDIGSFQEICLKLRDNKIDIINHIDIKKRYCNKLIICKSYKRYLTKMIKQLRYRYSL